MPASFDRHRSLILTDNKLMIITINYNIKLMITC